MPNINVEKNSSILGVTTFTWANATNGDTFTQASMHSIEGAVAAVHVTGTFGGATVSLQGTLRGSPHAPNWTTITDTSGSRIETTVQVLREFSTAVPFIKPEITGGSGTNVTIVVAVRS